MRKQFKLIAFNIVMAATAGAGITLSPESASEYAEAIVGFGAFVWLLGNALIIKWRAAKTPADTGNTTTTTALLVALIVFGFGLSACASRVAETPAQKVFGITADMQSAAVVILGYVESPGAKPQVKAALRKLYLAADDALLAAQKAVRAGDSPMMPALISAASSAVSELFDFMVTNGILGTPPPKSVSLADAAAAHRALTREFRHGYP